MKEPARAHHPTNADIVTQIDALAGRVEALEAELERQGKRLGTLEEKWGWLTDTLGRLLHRIDQIGERTVVMLQRHDFLDARFDDLIGRIDCLACARPVKTEPGGEGERS